MSRFRLRPEIVLLALAVATVIGAAAGLVAAVAG